jgi:hypothetical protein
VFHLNKYTVLTGRSSIADYIIQKHLLIISILLLWILKFKQASSLIIYNKLNHHLLCILSSKIIFFFWYCSFPTHKNLSIFKVTTYCETVFSRTLNFSQTFNSRQSNSFITVSIIINKHNEIHSILGHFPRLRYSQPSSPI